MQINPVKNRISNEQTAQQAQKIQRAEEVRQPLQEKPVEQAAKGEFYQEPGEDGPKVKFSDPEKADEKPLNVTTMNTDQVDREIERLRKKVEELKSQLDRTQEGPERKRLERQLKQAESDLKRKDNDTYRRQHAKIS